MLDHLPLRATPPATPDLPLPAVRAAPCVGMLWHGPPEVYGTAATRHVATAGVGGKRQQTLRAETIGWGLQSCCSSAVLCTWLSPFWVDKEASFAGAMLSAGL